MLMQATILMTLFAMAVTLWMGFYLFARGFSSRMTLRVVVVMLALSGFFFGAYNNIFVQTIGSAAIRAVLLVIVLGGWYSVTFHVMSDQNQQLYRFFEWGIYALAAASILLLLQPGAFLNEAGNALYVAHMNRSSWAYRVYGAYQFIVSFSIMLNLLVGDRVGLTSRGKYFLVTSIFPVVSVIYGVIALGGPNPAPRIIPDTLAFCGVFVLGLSVLRHQTWTERRATLQDFPLTTIGALGLAGISTFFAWRWGMPVAMLSSVTAFVILSVGAYDLTREFLERSRTHKESQFRRQIRQLESEGTGEAALKSRLQEGIDLLCQTLDAPGGFVAIRRGGEFSVMASRSSVAVGSVLQAESVACEDLSRPSAGQLSSLAWLAPSFEGRIQVAVVGIEKSRSRMEYSTGNLELLAEVADQIGTIVSLSNLQARPSSESDPGTSEASANAEELKSATGEMLDSIAVHTDAEFIKLVEEALRHLPDTVTLGQSALAEKMPIRGQSHIERGKQLQALLTSSIEAFKPADKRPPEPLPRVWYNHAVLYDAYVEGVPNREIMARLYISEGTFHRTRRNAIRGLARMLVEKSSQYES
ncbi:MAG TPA: hypothetical protein VFR47_32645 [Anaerolineales bacterium]|nr:hypothetical protein [Anaerolineales bacterium]